MATFYLDPEGGNDANDGTTFANRWKTILGGPTAARIAPGDEIRIIASRRNSLGNCSWTYDGNTITLPVAKTVDIDSCDTAWTASANVTATANTTQRQEGTGCANLAVAAGFTTGKIAYRQLPVALNLSAYEAISFLIRRTSGSSASGVFRIDLCSDTIGNTPVHSFTIPALGIPAGWQKLLFENGAALGTSIASIAIVALSDPGTVTLQIDNIIACKSRNHADHLSHICIVGKDTVAEPQFYNVAAISGTTVSIRHGFGDFTSMTAQTRFSGTTETVESFVIVPLDDPTITAANNVLQDAGTEAARITFSGGWNRTDMSTQTGETWISGGNQMPTTAFNFNDRGYVTLTNIGYCHFAGGNLFSYGPQSSSLGQDIELDLLGLVNIGGTIIPMNFGDGYNYLRYAANIDFTCQTRGAFLNSVNFSGSFLDLQIDRIDNHCVGGTTPYFNISAAGYLGSKENLNIRIGKWTRSTELLALGNGEIHIKGIEFVDLLDTSPIAVSAGKCFIDRPVNPPSIYALSAKARMPHVYMTNVNGDVSDYRHYFDTTSIIQTATDQRYVASGVSLKWTLAQNTRYRQNFPAIEPLVRVLCEANEPTTVSVWVRRSHLDLTGGIGVFGGSVAGISKQLVYSSAAINTWDQISVTFTPTERGVVEVFALGYRSGTNAGNLWFDEVEIT